MSGESLKVVVGMSIGESVKVVVRVSVKGSFKAIIGSPDEGSQNHRKDPLKNHSE